MNQRNRILSALIWLFGILSVVSVSMILGTYIQGQQEQFAFEGLASIIEQTEISGDSETESSRESETKSSRESETESSRKNEAESSSKIETESSHESETAADITTMPSLSEVEQVQDRTMLPKYAALYEMNSDFIGWLEIKNTKINYPIMFTPDDPQYYLYRAFDGTSAKSGALFIGAGGGVDSDCLIIYGHNMKNDTMFGMLDYYKNAAFWHKNTTFSFDTLYEMREYEVFASLECRVLYADEKGFRYYNASGNLTEAEFDELAGWLIKHSNYDTDIVPRYGEQILILSTCSYHTENGRFIVAARRVK